MIRLRLRLRLRRRRRLPECGVGDYIAAPDLLGCRDLPTRRVAFHCPTCGPRTRDVCDWHDTALTSPTAVCERCGQPIVFKHSTLAQAASQ